MASLHTDEAKKVACVSELDKRKGLERDDVFYGQVFLGKLIQGKGIYKPLRNKLMREKCYPCR